MLDGKRVEKRKTCVTERTLNPTFNELFMFRFPYERVRQTSLVISVMDLVRGLSLFSQVREYPQRVVVAVTMGDVAARHGFVIDTATLHEVLAVPVVVVDPRNPHCVAPLVQAIEQALDVPEPAPDPIPARCFGEESLESELAGADARCEWARATAALVTEGGPGDQ